MNARIQHISYYLPEKKILNEDLAKLFPVYSPQSLFKLTGILERSVAEANEISSDLAVKAAEVFFKEYDFPRDEIDFLIFCTQGPDYFAPTTACVIQKRLNLPQSIGALDINMGCTGFIYSLSLANGLIETGVAKNILLLNCAALVKHIHPLDRGTRILFSDAASAVLVSTSNEKRINNFVFGTDGSKAEIMMLKAGAFRHPFSSTDLSPFEDEFGNISSAAHFNMKGDEVMTFALNVVPNLVQEILDKNNLQIDEIDYFVFHQANLYLLKLLRKIIKIPDEKFCINLAHTGNTVSCTIPIALKDQMQSNKIKKGDKVMLVSFGVGASWGGTVLKI